VSEENIMIIIKLRVYRWKVGAPDNVGGTENCLVVDLTTGKAQLDDVPCNSTYQYICEVNIK
jgi:hypothetical protein